MLRSRSRYENIGEKPSTYSFNLENRTLRGMILKFRSWRDISVTSNATCLKLYQIQKHSLSIHRSDQFCVT